MRKMLYKQTENGGVLSFYGILIKSARYDISKCAL